MDLAAAWSASLWVSVKLGVGNCYDQAGPGRLHPEGCGWGSTNTWLPSRLYAVGSVSPCRSISPAPLPSAPLYLHPTPRGPQAEAPAKKASRWPRMGGIASTSEDSTRKENSLSTLLNLKALNNPYSGINVFVEEWASHQRLT